MLYIEDNFLTESEFRSLNDAALKHSTKKRNLYQDNNGWSEGCVDLKNNLVMPLVKFGKWQEPIIERLKVLVEQFVKPHPIIENVWFNYAQGAYIIPRHTDIITTNDPADLMKKSFKIFIYAHEQWEESWGGKLCFDAQEIVPVPNRLVMYTMDEAHWTTPITTDALRIFWGIRFGHAK